MASLAELQAMARALEVSLGGGRATFPNPLVGAVVLDPRGNSAGEGFHQVCGGPHAEVLALRQAGEAASGGTLVVTLEPCCHYGRTAPCTDAVLEAGISRVVIAMVDPDPRISGRGIELLREGGLQVETGVLNEEARKVNRVYLHYRDTGRSWVRLKLAASMDGRIAAADGTSKWLTCETSRHHVHRMRAESSAILTGAGTVRVDDPALTVRHAPQDPSGAPVRIVVTASGDLGEARRVLEGEAETVIAVTEGSRSSSMDELADLGAEIWQIPPEAGCSSMDLSALLKRTAEENLGTVLAECGSSLATSLLKRELVNSLAVFTAPVLLGDSGRPAVEDLGIRSISGAVRLENCTVTASGTDALMEGEVVYRTD